MKCFAVLAVLTFLCVFNHVSANVALIKALAGTCKTAEKASDDDVDKLAEGKVPETPAGKCLAGELRSKMTLKKASVVFFFSLHE